MDDDFEEFVAQVEDQSRGYDSFQFPDGVLEGLEGVKELEILSVDLLEDKMNDDDAKISIKNEEASKVDKVEQENHGKKQGFLSKAKGFFGGFGKKKK